MPPSNTQLMPGPLPAAGGFGTTPSQGGLGTPVNNPSYLATPGANLPTLPATPASTVTVGTSNLANQNFNVQQAGFNQLDQNVQQHTQAKAGANPQVSIVDLLDSKGQASDYASRAKLAQQYGIQNYTGSAAQNMQLINLVNQGQQPQGQTTTTKTDGQPATTTTTGPTQPTQPETPQTYEQKVNDVTNQFQNIVDQHMKDLQSLRDGTFPLSTYEQAQLDATQKNLDRAREMQLTANANYEKAVANAQFRTGTNLTDPQQFLAKNQQIISDDISKISALDNQAALTMNTLRQSFMDKDYKLINEQYTELKDLLKTKSDTIDKVQKRTDDMAKDLRDYNEKVREFEEKQKLDVQKTNAEVAKIYQDIAKTKQDMELSIDPKTGKPISNKPPTAEQSKAAGFASRLQQSNATFDALATDVTSLSTAKFAYYKALPSALQPAFIQQQIQAEQNFVNAQLRRESGAAISTDEFTKAEKQYFPQPGDSPEVLAQKKANRALAQANLVREAGSAYDSTLVQEVAPQQTLQTYYKAHPEKQTQINTMISENPSLTDEDILQIING